MPAKRVWIVGGGIGFLALVVVLTALLIPEGTHPAYALAVDFVKAAGQGDDETALAALSDDLRSYVASECPEGSISACIAEYIPEDWGGFLNAVFRRAQPDGPRAWDILLLATYAENQGFSGVCIYNRAEQQEDGSWRIVRWSGWISCDDPNAGLSALAQASAANRAP